MDRTLHTPWPLRRPAPPERFAGVLLTVLLVLFVIGAAPGAQPQGPHGAAPAHAAVAGEVHGEGDHGETWGATLSRLANFAILAAGLWYFLRTPLGAYLEGRSRDIRQGLEDARALRARAAAQLGEVEARMAALPGELEALRARGVEEIRSEGERIRRVATEERGRLLDQMRREIDLQLQAARRDLRRDAAALAVSLAERRVAAIIDEADQRRLIGRYISQVQANV